MLQQQQEYQPNVRLVATFDDKTNVQAVANKVLYHFEDPEDEREFVAMRRLMGQDRFGK